MGGISNIIWANNLLHNLLLYMQKTFQNISNFVIYFLRRCCLNNIPHIIFSSPERCILIIVTATHSFFYNLCSKKQNKNCAHIYVQI
jgi:hypothetical protein